MEDAKQQIVERLKQANNVLITVSRDPSVDQLAAAIGLALFLNKLGKHASAVYSGRTPSVIEFLQPEKTLEKNTDSLRDFIIALDKSKADKLRYKVEDQHVKIFITPYRTSISQEDLEFSQGDFNVDVVLALGVQEQKDLDLAITAHGRILHDATVVSVSKHPGASLGSMNWVQTDASSLCEMVTEVADAMKPNGFDSQMSTALLTGIVAETGRFSNEKTTSVTMSVSAKLLAAGANQQLVAESLQPKPAPPPPPPPPPAAAPIEPVNAISPLSKPVDANAPLAPLVPEAPQDQGLSLPPVQPQPAEEKPSDGALYISHESEQEGSDDETPESDEPELEQIHIDEQGELRPIEEVQPAEPLKSDDSSRQPSRMVLEPPTMGGAMAATGQPEPFGQGAAADGGRHLLTGDGNLAAGMPAAGDEQPLVDPMGFISTPVSGAANSSGYSDPTLDSGSASAPAATVPPLGPLPAADTPAVPAPNFDDKPLAGGAQTLTDLEQAVSSPHVQGQEGGSTTVAAPAAAGLDAARDAVNDAMNSNAGNQPLPPISALNAQPVNIGLPGDQPLVQTPTLPQEPAMPVQSEPLTSDFSFPDHLIQPTNPPADPNSSSSVAGATDNPAPPVPPPMMPGIGGLPSIPGPHDTPTSGVPFPPKPRGPIGY